MTKPTRTDDIVEIQQLLAKYAVTITQGDIEGLVSVFTPDGTYSAFGETYALERFPVLVDAAPKGLFMTGTALVDLDGDTATGTQPLCFIVRSADRRHERRRVPVEPACVARRERPDTTARRPFAGRTASATFARD